MITDKNIRDFENTYLKKVTAEIKTQLNKAVTDAGSFKREAIELQKTMWEEVRCTPTDLGDLDAPAQLWQYQVDISNQARKYKRSADIVGRLEKMLKSPYFGRIDFKEEGEEAAEKIYIGIYNLSKAGSMEILVYDWRAPISGMFYDYEIGPSGYDCPMGRINGQMLLKRQYKIENERILYMFDSSLRINDEMLQEVLGKSTDNRMRTIVTSIQKEQNRVIRDDRNKVLVVQGPAGSGKTSIALHRAAFLLYKYRENIKSENILIFSPNHVFEDYISNVLPELGEENVKSSTFADFFAGMIDAKYRIETMNGHMEYILKGKSDSIRLKSIKLKATYTFLTILQEYMKFLDHGGGIIFKSLSYEGALIISSEEISRLFKEDYNYLPYLKRLEKLRQRLFYLTAPYEEKLIDDILKNDLSADSSLNETEKRTMASQKAKALLKPILNEIEQMTSVDIYRIYGDLIRNLKTYFCKESCGRLCDNINEDDLENIGIYTIRRLEQGFIDYEDLAPIILLITALGGEYNAKAIKHVIIDEAQDYTAVQYEVLRRTFEHCNITILGDLNQTVNAYMNIGSFDITADIFGTKGTAHIKLTKSYRSTLEISDFCNKILHCRNDAEQLERHGHKPEIFRCNRENLYSEIAGDIKQLKNSGHKLIAVICKTAGQCERVYQSIRTYVDISLITNQKEVYKEGVVTIPSYLAKGLEFDAVIVCTADEWDYSGEVDRRLLYTVCTRALHELHLYYCDELTGLIRDRKNITEK